MDLIGMILELELQMFLTVPVLRRSSCQDDPSGFFLHRRVQFSVWGEEALHSYLNDLQTAQAQGFNLMTYKYARMDDLIPPRREHHLIDRIVALQTDWQRKVLVKYPALTSTGRPLEGTADPAQSTSFVKYLRAELESYSDRTIRLLYKETLDKAEEGINLSEQVYEALARLQGYASLADAELKLRRLRTFS